MIRRGTPNSSMDKQLEIMSQKLRAVRNGARACGFAVDPAREQCKGANGACLWPRVEPKAFVTHDAKEEVPKHSAQKRSELSGAMQVLQESKQEKEVAYLVVDEERNEEPEAPAEDSEPSGMQDHTEASARDVCDHYRRLLTEYYVSVDTGNREALEYDDDDDISLTSELEDDDISFSDMDSIVQDSIVLRRHQMQPVTSCGSDIIETVVTTDDEEDMDSLAFDTF